MDNPYTPYLKAHSSIIDDWFLLATVESTHTLLLDKAKQDTLSKLQICLAEKQTHGRGRRGRSWHMPNGDSLFLSLRWPANTLSRYITALPICLGITLSNTLNALLDTRPITVKWPNDLYAQGKKLGGILVEVTRNQQHQSQLIVSLGLNLRFDSPLTEIDQPAIDLASLGHTLSKPKTVSPIIECLLATLKQFEASQHHTLLAQWPKIDFLHQKPLQLEQKGQHDYGFTQGLELDGRLRFRSCITGKTTLLSDHNAKVRPLGLMAFLVGGAVRDELLKLNPGDRDWVVVGHTPEQMQAQGFRPVGKSFPVFLHPKTQEEYALARHEKKAGTGHQGFVFNTSTEVTLVEDLKRRDLTINAIAKTASGDIIDPFNGQNDLQNRVLRHVSEAFAEDPLRVLRVARFCAQLGAFHFSVAPETLSLMRHIVQTGELATLSYERIWLETEKALRYPFCENFWKVLGQVHALSLLFPHVDLPGLKAAYTLLPHTQNTLIRYSLLLANTEKPLLPQAIPKPYLELHRLFFHYKNELLVNETTSAETLLKLLTQTDAVRRPERFELLLGTCKLWWQHANQIPSDKINFAYAQLTKAQNKLKAFKPKLEGLEPQKIKNAIHQQKIQCLK